jgi:ATP-dependent Clp protease ATP-binding subunit ClpB
MGAIVDIQIERLERLLADREIHLDLEPSGKEWLANEGYDVVYGARPLKRVIQRELQNPLAQMILNGTLKEGDTVRVTGSRLGLILTPVPAAQAA